MASHFRWYPSETETVIPMNARYQFPAQASKAIKMTPRIPAKVSGDSLPGSVIRVEFPAQGYVNPGKTTLEFDVTMQYPFVDTDGSKVRFQNNIQSIFQRVRLLYGSTTLEDIPNYNVIVRAITEWTSTGQQGVMDQGTLREGIGGVTYGMSGNNSGFAAGVRTGTGLFSINGNLQPGLVNVRQNLIHGIDLSTPPVDTLVASTTSLGAQVNIFGSGAGMVPNTTTTAGVVLPVVATTIHALVVGTNPVRRYQVQLFLGIFNQDKLLPVKFMASQLAIELTLANAADCMIWEKAATVPAGQTCSYSVKNINLIPEILEFDATYDEVVLKGIIEGGMYYFF